MRKISESEFEQLYGTTEGRKYVFATINQQNTRDTLSATFIFDSIRSGPVPHSIYFSTQDKRSYILLNGVIEIILDEDSLYCGDIVHIKCSNYQCADNLRKDETYVFLID